MVVAALALFVLYPLLVAAAAPRAEDWLRALTTARWRVTMLNTLQMAALSTISSVIIGFLYAYAVTRARIPGARLFMLVPLLPLITPPFVSGLAFILLFGRRGLVTYELLGLNTDIYGWHGLWLAQTVSFFPIAFLAIAGVLRSINPNLERASESLGAGRWTTFRTVVVPLAAPGVGAAALLVAIAVLGDFGNPMLIAGRYRVLATEAYLQISGWADMRMGAVLGLALLMPAIAFFFLQRRLQGSSVGRFVTVGGRGSRIEPAPVSPMARWGLFTFCLLIALFMLAKYAVILLGAFTPVWGVDYTFTLDNFRRVVVRGPELWNSLRFAGSAALVCAVLATISAYLVYRVKVPFGRALDLVSLLPAAIPGTLLGIAYVLAFNTPPLQLTGTATIIVISMVFSYLPVGYRIAAATLHQLAPSIEESAADMGASSMRTFFDVVLPLISTSFSAALVYCFVKAIGTLSAVVFLISHGTVVASASILNLAEQGYWGWAAALASLLVGIALLTLGVAKLVFGRRFAFFDI
ncbi:MAG: iron ABC transporter permease [Trueperaceae bacterium]|nr:iron ABC transporter permease [Trueperaceae bacterium]